jgi:hypothetical protein
MYFRYTNFISGAIWYIIWNALINTNIFSVYECSTILILAYTFVFVFQITSPQN